MSFGVEAAVNMNTVSRRVADKAVLSVCFNVGWDGESPVPTASCTGRSLWVRKPHMTWKGQTNLNDSCCPKDQTGLEAPNSLRRQDRNCQYKRVRQGCRIQKAGCIIRSSVAVHKSSAAMIRSSVAVHKSLAVMIRSSVAVLRSSPRFSG